ncbi:hypothetical protein SPRG_02773 [Saprolegnia parasitica CBS 223.65]|uniref:Uncharacterized protein n=1 Tax=Saprolegnia parasitica (strain CBS 223.65) TaxID=695850 RepID=A0A067CNN6_SAPPC|nr:hypothetical protein SPRG_02773 [Saprolegnia parasitica CBS 223.65]KDO32294.1 hypothetical protein SPRG_02773 [Saprolegnia parasitica CBS 223.65]|eukprot:XP_012196750.1 hypothetical protein SPRG_02773 [Saprolegnia parasitica CBS 223.65]
MSTGVRPRSAQPPQRRGWAHGDILVEESDLGADAAPVRPAVAAKTALPRLYRVVTCALLFLVGTAALMYRNLELQSAREDRLLIEIQHSIAEMDQIAAAAATMEAHAQRLASIAQTQLDAQMHELTNGRLVTQQEKIRAEVDAIHVETMQHMQSMMEAMVETTRKEALDMMLHLSDDLARDPIAPVEVEPTSDDESAYEQAVKPTHVPTPAAPVPVARPSNVTKPSRPSALDMLSTPRFWVFSTLCTTCIVLIVVSCMQRRATFVRYRLATQRFLHRIRLCLYTVWIRICRVFGVGRRAWHWLLLKKTQLSTAVYWSPTKGDVPPSPYHDRDQGDDDDDDVEDESVYFYPQTPNPDRQTPGRTNAPRVQFSFSDDEDDGLDVTSSFGRQSHYVNAQSYEDVLTPLPAARLPKAGFQFGQRAHTQLGP